MRHLITVFFLLSSITIWSQNLVGKILDENGEPLPYVSIYLKGTTTGTTTNLEGNYEFKLDPGSYTILYQFVGYETVTRQLKITNERQEVNLTMKPQSTLLNEVVIAADAEDPAYAIIRKAQAKRAYYKSLKPDYACDVYVKGNQKILNAPEKVMGVEVGDMDGMLDSNRQGIVYLSESVSRLHVSGDNYKEVVNSSKISGNDRGYSFNSAREMEFTFYDNAIELQRQMVSPIAENAMNYYNYKLEGVFQSESNQLINKIKVIPKRAADPSFYGTIYITDGLWNIHSLDLGATKTATQIYFIDSLTFTQIFVPTEVEDHWAVLNNTINFKIDIFNFVLKGVFTGVYSNYDFAPNFTPDFFNEIVHVVEPESNKRDTQYWESIRPVPLTQEEIVDYTVKDSIFEVRNDPIYMDSVDRRGNRFNVGNILGGYNYTRRSKHKYFDISSPISSLSFNTVQGYNASLSFDYRKYFDEEETRRILLGGKANYGLAEKKFRANGYVTWRPSRLSYNQFTISGGSSIRQFNDAEPISTTINTAYTLLLRENYAKYLDLKRLRLLYFFEPTSGVFITSTLAWEERSPLVNNSDVSYFRKEEITFTSNDPLNPENFAPSFERHQALIFGVDATIRFKQKYFLYPDRKFGAGSKGPLLRLSYRAGIPAFDTDIKFQKIALSLSDEQYVGVGGRFEWYVNGGIFFAKERMNFRDFRHFNTSEILLMNTKDYANSFLQLPYYNLSNNDNYLQVHLQHHFDGWILNKIPGFSKLGWSLAAGTKFLMSTEESLYSEQHIGIDNIGIGFLRLIRVDLVHSSFKGESNLSVRLGIGF